MANATFLYAGTGQGLVIATRPGTSKEWNIVRRALEGRSVSALARGETFPVRLLAALDGEGLLHSPNGGRSWQQVFADQVTTLAADPRNTEHVFAAAAPGAANPTAILRSGDGGLSWEPCAPLPAGGAGATSLIVTRWEADGRGGIVWVGLQSGGLLYSKDGGDSWLKVPPGPVGDQSIRALVAASSSETRLYAATADGLCRVALSATGEARQERVEGGAPAGIRQLLLLGMLDRPGATALLAVAEGGGLWHGEDAVHWSALAAAEGSGLAGEQVTVLADHPEYPDRAYLGTAGGALMETTSRGRQWQRLNVAAGEAVQCLATAVLK